MSDILWRFADNNPSEEIPYEILKDFARKLSSDTEGMFTADILQTIQNEDNSVICSFYLVVPELRSYSYKLMELVQPRFDKIYPIAMSLFGKAEGNVISDVATNSTELRAKITAFITNPLTMHILTSLKTQIEIYKDFQ